MAEIGFFEHLIRSRDFKAYIKGGYKSTKKVTDKGINEITPIRVYFEGLEDIYIDKKDGCFDDIHKLRKNAEFWKTSCSIFKEFKQYDEEWDIDECLAQIKYVKDNINERTEVLFHKCYNSRTKFDKFVKLMKGDK